MPKHYSSLRSLASNSTTPYGKGDTSTPSTFNLPNLVGTTSSSTSKGGKSIHDYASFASIASSTSSCSSAKHIVISSGEYRRGSFDIGNNLKDAFRDGDKYPSAIYVNKYITEYGTSSIDPNYSSVDSIEDLGGTYVNSTGTTVNYTISPTLLTGNDTDNPGTGLEDLILVYSGADLAPYAGKRTIKVNFNDGTSVTFPDVVIPGWKNNTGIGENLTSWTPGSTSVQNNVFNCGPNSSYINAHAHTDSGYINNYVTPLFVYPNEMYNLAVTGLGTHHDNVGLWNEGFQPNDNLTVGSSTNTKAHQETWPLGLFYNLPATEEGWGIVSTRPSVADTLSVSEMWDAQYNGSELTNISTLPNERGTPLKADSVQHYKLIQGQILRQAAWTPTRGFATQWQSTQHEYFMGNLSGLTNTNTADDGGAWYAQIETEMMAGIGSIWHDSSLTYSTHEGGATDGLIGNPGNTKVTPSFQSVQIYVENLQCASCAASPSSSTPIDMCTDSNSPEYYLWSGVDCTGAAIPAGLMNGTESWGQFGCTNCDYELVASPTCTACDCSGPIPEFVFNNIHAPTTLGGNDGWADIQIDAGSSGNEGWVYLVEPLANTSAGLGVGAVDSISAVASSSGVTVNGNWTFTYSSGSTSGEHLQIEFIVSNAPSPVFTLKQFANRGKGFVTGETITLTSGGGSSITLTVNSVTGVPVLIRGANNHVHYADPTSCSGQTPTAIGGLKATIGTGTLVYLQHVGATGLNNYGWAPINNQSLPGVPGLPFKDASLFSSYAFDNSTDNSYAITGMEAGQYKVTVIENNYCIAEERGCFTQQTLVIPPGVNSTNGCTDNNAGTNDGAALNYDATATVDDGSCIYCRAADGKLVDNNSIALNIAGAANDGDIFTSTNNSTTAAATTSVATDGSISYTRTLNSIMSYYAGQIVDATGAANAEFKMELWKRTSSTQTLTGASQVGATVTTPTNVGFNYDFDSVNWSTGLTYGYYAIKSYVDDPDSASEQEQCFQVDYFIVPVLACIIGQPGMQTGITTDNVTITDLDLVVSSIPGNNLNPCTTQCCDDPTAIVGYVQNSSIPGCADPYFNVSQTCPAGNLDHVTTVTAEIQKLINGVWTTVVSNVDSTPNIAPGTTIFGATYVIFVYWQHGPGDYRVNHILDYTWPNGTTSQCEAPTNVINLNSPICGCTDPTSLNYNPLATIDDGSCTYCVYGCTDPNAPNYNSLATCDDGSCIGCMYGCMDPAATNYNSAATCDDGSCNYGVGCGCMDILASNYGYNAAGNFVGLPPTCSDGSCIYGGLFCDNPPLIDNIFTIDATCLPSCNTIHIYGCTDNTALNYDSTATIDDGSCTYCIYGCMTPASVNYNPNATCDDGTCIAAVYGCTDPTACDYDPLANTSTPCDYSCYGCTDPTEPNYNKNCAGQTVIATIDDGCCKNLVGCTDSTATNYDSNATIACNGCCVYGVLGCTDSTADNYDPLATIDDGSCIFTGACPNAGAQWLDTNGNVGSPFAGTLGPIGSYTGSSARLLQDSNGDVWICGEATCGTSSSALGLSKYNASTGVWSDTTYNICDTYPMVENPSAVFDSSNNLYISLGQVGDHRILKHDGISLTTLYQLTVDGAVTGGAPISGNTLAWHNINKIIADSNDQIYVHTSVGIWKYAGTGTGSSAFTSIFDYTNDTGPGGETLAAVTNPEVLFVDSSDNLYTVNRFNINATTSENRVMKYNGTSWSFVGGSTGLEGWPAVGMFSSNIVEDSTGKLYYLGHTGDKKAKVSVYNGSSWSLLSATNDLMLSYASTYYPGFSSAHYGAAEISITSGDVLVVSYSTGSQELVVLQLDLNVTNKYWSYFTPNPDPVVSSSKAANVLVTNSDDIWVLGRDTSVVKAYKLDCTIPAPLVCTGTTSIPDSEFETLLINQAFDSGTVDGSVLNTNICNVTNLNISTGYILDCNNFGSVTNLTGVEGFQSIEFLGIMGHPITTIDVTNNITLKEIQASWTLFTNINLSTLSQLKSFEKLGNNYSATCQIPASGTKTLETIVLPNPSVMTDLEVSNNKLTTLTLANQTSMTICRVKENLLTSIDTSGATALTLLECSDNQLITLDVSANIALTILRCTDNQLTSIDLGSTIDLSTLSLKAQSNNASLVIHVGSAARVTQAQALFTTANGSISTGTTFDDQ